mgnify:CR=1 FL=1
MLLARTEEAVAFAVKEGLPVMYVTEDTTRAHPETLRRLYTTAIRCGAVMLPKQVADLFQPFGDADMGEMQRQEADGPAVRFDETFQGRVARVERVDHAAHRQDMEPGP